MKDESSKECATPPWRYSPSYGGFFEYDVNGRKILQGIDHGMKRQIESEYYGQDNNDFLEQCAREVYQRRIEQGRNRGR